jgi:cyclic dehypoxanthinyl futalosine synthase
MPPRWEKTLSRARSGERLSPAETLVLYRDAPLEKLGETAHELRLARSDPRIVTYLIDRNVNYTNLCTTNCLFCAFYRPPGHEEGYVLDYEEVTRKLEELAAIGGTRVLLQGGHHPELPLSWYEGLLRHLKGRFPRTQLDAFSPSEIENIARIEGIPMEEVLERLRAAGQDGLPGGGAEILVDEVRSRISRKKQSADGWFRAMEIAQGLGLTTSATMVIGFGESREQRVIHLDRLRGHQDRALGAHGNGFRAFISWTFQRDNTALGRIGRRHGWALGAVGEEYLRNVAIARIHLDNFPHHQASWPTQGRDVARAALSYGCDDFGSTMMEENVVASAGSLHSALAEHSILREIRSAGYLPVQRDSDYHLVGSRSLGATAGESPATPRRG